MFTDSADDMVVPPLLDTWTQLQSAVDEQVARLVTAPGVLDLEGASAAIDFASQLVLAPELVLEEDPEDAGDSEDSGE